MVSTTSASEGEPVSFWILAGARGKKETVILGGSFLPEPSRPCQTCLGEGKMLSVCQLQPTHAPTQLCFQLSPQ